MKRNRQAYRLTVVGIIILMILAYLNPVQAQYVGLNGQGFFENRTEQSDEWIAELFGDKPFTLRFPGGAATKYADPLAAGGWGFTYEGIDTITELYSSKAEENIEATEEILAKWKRKADAQPMGSYLDQVIELQDMFPNMRVIWSANYLIPAERAIFPVEYLLAHDVNIVAVEMGNESYSQMRHDFDAYWARTRDLAARLNSLGVEAAYPCPPVTGRASKKHRTWATALSERVGNDGVVFHPYYDAREFPALGEVPIDHAAYYEQVDAFDFRADYQDAKAWFPTAGFFLVTETNSQPSSLIGDTHLNAYLIDKLLDAGSEEFQDFLIHNGVAPDKYGIIYGTDNNGGQRKNTAFATFKDFMDRDDPEGPGDCELVVIGYDTTYTTQDDPDPFAQRFCLQCERWWFHLFNARVCRVVCDEAPPLVVDTVIAEVYGCAEDTVGNPDPPQQSIQPLDADTLHFHNEVEFERFLRFHGIGSYDIERPKYRFNCADIPEPSIYPSQVNDDWQHEERFLGLPFMSIYDHITTRKHIVIFFPSHEDLTGEELDFCGVVEGIQHPETGQWAVFYDTFNWYDERGENMFNLNKKLYLLWGLDGKIDTQLFKVNGDGVDFKFCTLFPAHCDGVKLNNRNAAIYYGHMRNQ